LQAGIERLALLVECFIIYFSCHGHKYVIQSAMPIILFSTGRSPLLISFSVPDRL
jgi:hypothetical protein